MTIAGEGWANGVEIEFLLPWHAGDPWYKAPAWKKRGNPLLDMLEASLCDHLPGVLESARKLRADGWRIRLTVCGLGCRPPGRVLCTIGDWIEGEEDPWLPYFRGLGLAVHPVDCSGAPRGVIEIMAAQEEAFDRVWYERSVRDMIRTGDDPFNPGTPPTPPAVLGGAMKAQMKLEAKYGQESLETAVDNAFEAGMINGKLSCLRWVLGDPWDSLDT